MVSLAPVFERARAIDDARQPLREHAERDAHAREQEHRTQRQLDDVGDVFGLQVDAGHGARSLPQSLNLSSAALSHGWRE